MQSGTVAGDLWQPSGVDPKAPSLPTTPFSPGLRRRSFPAHTLEPQEKDAAVMVGEKNAVTTSQYGHSVTTKPSFFKRHFYRIPRLGTEDDGQAPQPGRFSLLSRGSLTCFGLLFLMIVAIVLCAVFATIYQCGRGRHRFPHPHLSPIRQAIYANFPDPAIIEHEGMWYAFATNNAAGILKMPTNQSSYEFGSSNVQIATSKDYANWTLMDSLHDPLPTLGAWVTNQMSDTHPPVPKANVWAPEILQRPDDGKFIMYYSAAAKNATGSHCIGAAISDSGPAGPYTALDGPIVCPVHVGGAIDPVSFVDVDGTMYIAWKIDGNNAGHGGICGNTVPPLVDTPIRISRLKADGVTLDGEPISIMDREKGDGPLVEAPSLIRTDDGFYFLFFSSGCTRAPSYDVKYAWAKNVTGPYTRGNYPLLKSGDFGLSSPGSIGMRRSSSGQVQMAFHARITTHFGRVRAMYTTRLQFNGTSVALGDPIPVVST